jgi:alcohol dehydrogenase class IV
MMFEFATARRIIFGPGTSRQAGGLARKAGRRALVVTGRDAARAQFLLDSLRENGVSFVVFSAAGEPSIDTLRQGLELAQRENCDLVVSIGGGGALDTGKAIAVMLTNAGDVMDYLEVIGAGKVLSEPSAPFLALPTTAGTGSEVTRNAVLDSPEHRQKVSLRAPSMLPSVAIVDSELTWSSPPATTAASGMDALTQLIEPYVCIRANPVTDAFCEKGMKLVAGSLRLAFENGRHAAAREDMALASLLGGLALNNAGLGAVHGFAGAIGGMYHAPHGAICAALLPHVMEANMQALRRREPRHDALRRYEQVARLLTDRPTASAEDGVPWVRQLARDLRISSLGTYGMIPADFAEIIEKGSKAGSMKANPIVLTEEEQKEILERASAA